MYTKLRVLKNSENLAGDRHLFFLGLADFMGVEVVGHEGVGEDGAGFGQEVFQNNGVAGGIAGAEVGHDQLLDSGGEGNLSSHGGSGMEPLVSKFGILVGEGGFMDEDIGSTGEFDGAFTKNGVGAVDKAASWLRCATEVGTVNDAAIREGDGFASLEFAVEGAGGDTQFGGPLDVKASGAIFFSNAVAKGGDAVGEGSTLDGKAVILKQDAGADGMHLDRVRKVGLRIASTGP